MTRELSEVGWKWLGFVVAAWLFGACSSEQREFASGSGGQSANGGATAGGSTSDAAGEAGAPGDGPQGGRSSSAGSGAGGSNDAAGAGGLPNDGTAAGGVTGEGGEPSTISVSGGTGESGLKGEGLACSAGSECESGHCRDEVCCATACSGACEACAEAFTGQPNGTCASVVSGMDPHDDCEASSAESCGHDGACDGEGACRNYGTNQVCRAASCASSTYSPASTCDGQGACSEQEAVACGEYPCSAEGCETPCTEDTDCPAQTYCATDVCRNKKTDGDACSERGECRSGACVDGVCCENACEGSCVACVEAKTGQESGRCAVIPAMQDPDDECSVDSANSCGTDGVCNGGGQCRVPAVGTACGAASCDGNSFTPAGSCDGASSCVAGTPRNCAGNLTCASSTACRTSCTTDMHCVAGYHCASGACTPFKDQGAQCSTGAECSSGSCRDGVCCQSACSLSCQACSAATTGLANGICGARTSSASKPCTAGGTTSCVDVTSNVNNCGACGNVCSGSSLPGTAPVCSASTCSISCPAGTLGDGSNVCIPVTTVAGGPAFACGLLTDGHVKCWGNTSSTGLNPAGLSNVLFKSITAGSDFMCGIRDNGLAYCWGTNAPSVHSGTFYALAAGDNHVCGIKSNRTLDCWTRGSDGTDSPPTGTYKWLASGTDYSCAIVQGGSFNGRGTCWGAGTAILNNFPSTSNSQTYTQMWGAGLGSWGMRADGTVTSWGKIQFSPPSGTVFKALGHGSTQNRCGILTDGSLTCWGTPGSDATIPPSGTFTAVGMGGSFACGVKSGGAMTCWGSNDLGQAPTSVTGTFQGYW